MEVGNTIQELAGDVARTYALVCRSWAGFYVRSRVPNARPEVAHGLKAQLAKVDNACSGLEQGFRQAIAVANEHAGTSISAKAGMTMEGLKAHLRPMEHLIAISEVQKTLIALESKFPSRTIPICLDRGEFTARLMRTASVGATSLCSLALLYERVDKTKGALSVLIDGESFAVSELPGFADVIEFTLSRIPQRGGPQQLDM